MEMTKTEQKKLLSKFKKTLKRAGLTNRMRIEDIPEFEVVELQIADKNGSYEEDVSFIVVYSDCGLDLRFCYAEYTDIIYDPIEEEIVAWLKENNELKGQ